MAATSMFQLSRKIQHDLSPKNQQAAEKNNEEHHFINLL
ncbi:hypothetical protein PRUPE_3G207100 [Prunus persica]|uniref:Uncharacterized protein n=1 Tax=Prunus persica TaxID=3760 RepID=A0A251Q3A1_PRUPE|nr:hypothetical protein PRUPE_3G207100 [Prunus persica]